MERKRSDFAWSLAVGCSNEPILFVMYKFVEPIRLHVVV